MITISYSKNNVEMQFEHIYPEIIMKGFRCYKVIGLNCVRPQIAM